jgi:hypothetical protein
MSAKSHFDEFLTYITSAAFSASVLSFSMDVVKALSLGIVGGFAGMFGRFLWFKLFPKK